jgi:hypothetical protein
MAQSKIFRLPLTIGVTIVISTTLLVCYNLHWATQLWHTNLWRPSICRESSVLILCGLADMLMDSVPLGPPTDIERPDSEPG